jgi:hypothetical protein
VKLKAAVNFFAEQLAVTLEAGYDPVRLDVSQEDDEQLLIVAFSRDGSALSAVRLPISEIGPDKSIEEIQLAFHLAMEFIKTFHAGRR